MIKTLLFHRKNEIYVFNGGCRRRALNKHRAFGAIWFASKTEDKTHLASSPGHWYYSPGKATSIMKNIHYYIITAALVALAPLARAEHKTPTVGLYGQSLKAKTEKPDIFGRTKTTYKNKSYKTLGTSCRQRSPISLAERKQPTKTPPTKSSGQQ